VKTDGDQPAFPVVLGDSAYSGMTLRQWYAGMAMQGLVTHWGSIQAGITVVQSFEIADAMLQAEGE